MRLELSGSARSDFKTIIALFDLTFVSCQHRGAALAFTLSCAISAFPIMLPNGLLLSTFSLAGFMKNRIKWRAFVVRIHSSLYSRRRRYQNGQLFGARRTIISRVAWNRESTRGWECNEFLRTRGFHSARSNNWFVETKIGTQSERTRRVAHSVFTIDVPRIGVCKYAHLSRAWNQCQRFRHGSFRRVAETSQTHCALLSGQPPLFIARKVRRSQRWLAPTFYGACKTWKNLSRKSYFPNYSPLNTKRVFVANTAERWKAL